MLCPNVVTHNRILVVEQNVESFGVLMNTTKNTGEQIYLKIQEFQQQGSTRDHKEHKGAKLFINTRISTTREQLLDTN